MNWDDEATISFGVFLTEWQRATEDPLYRPRVGNSANDAASRFVAALMDIE